MSTNELKGPEAKYIKIISSDNHEFIIKKDVALTSGKFYMLHTFYMFHTFNMLHTFYIHVINSSKDLKFGAYYSR